MVRAFLILIAGSFLIAAIVTPFAMELIQWIDPGNRWPFSRVFARFAQLSAAIIIYKLRREFNLAELKKRLSAGTIAQKAGHLIFGLVLTSVTIALVIPRLVSVGLLSYSAIGSGIYLEIGKILGAMLLVSLLEESFFRVLIFSSLRRKVTVFLAAVISSLLYAFVHFIAPVRSFKPAEFDPLNGFIYLGEVLNRYLQPEVYAAFFGLFIVGLILCYVIYSTNSLFLCIGLHMGWASGLKAVRMVTVLSGGEEIPKDILGRYFLVAQPEAWISMLLVFVCLMIAVKTRLTKRVELPA